MLWPNQNICQDQDLPANHFAGHVIHSWPNQQPCLVDRSQSVFYFVPQENRRLWISQSSRLDYCLVEFSTYYTLLGQMLSFVVKSAAALLSCLLFAFCANPDKGDAVPSLALDISLLDIFMAPLERNAELNSKFLCATQIFSLLKWYQYQTMHILSLIPFVRNRGRSILEHIDLQLARNPMVVNQQSTGIVLCNHLNKTPASHYKLFETYLNSICLFIIF